jgi:hypothetical protein
MDIDTTNTIPKSPIPDFDPSTLDIDYSTRDEWEAIVPPNLLSHNPLKFKYLIHGIAEASVSRFMNPTGIEKAYVSLSLIDKLHSATYYPCGQILAVPSACIFGASGGDLGVGNKCNNDAKLFKIDIENAVERAGQFRREAARKAIGEKMYPKRLWRATAGPDPTNPKEVKKVLEKYKKKTQGDDPELTFPMQLLTPEEVLERTSPNAHNEVCCLGHIGEKKIEVVGLFVIITGADATIREGLNPTVKPQGVSDAQWDAIGKAVAMHKYDVVAIKYDKETLGPAK